MSRSIYALVSLLWWDWEHSLQNTGNRYRDGVILLCNPVHQQGHSSLTADFYCDEVLSGRLAVRVVTETAGVLAFHHTKPYYPVHIVVIPKQHIESLISLTDMDDSLLLDLLRVVRQVAAQVLQQQGGCRVITNLGNYQDSKHLHFHVGAGDPLR